VAECDPNGDPGQPCAERAVAAPGSETPERDHERLLRRILGFVEVAQDPVTGSHEGRTLAFDEEPERFAVTGQHGIHSGAFIDDLVANGWTGDG
jgi:hypothetical protein